MPVYHHLGVWKQGEAIVVRFGDHRILDLMTVNKIGDELYSVAERLDCCHLVLNFSSVDRISSLMLGKLLTLKRKMESKGGTLALCEVGPEVREVFAETRLDCILDIRDTEMEALRPLAT
jgi:anti-sigma B factor antagonist